MTLWQVCKGMTESCMSNRSAVYIAVVHHCDLKCCFAATAHKAHFSCLL